MVNHRGSLTIKHAPSFSSDPTIMRISLHYSHPIVFIYKLKRSILIVCILTNSFNPGLGKRCWPCHV